jgi:hypothetical protein
MSAPFSGFKPMSLHRRQAPHLLHRGVADLEVDQAEAVR